MSDDVIKISIDDFDTEEFNDNEMILSTNNEEDNDGDLSNSEVDLVLCGNTINVDDSPPSDGEELVDFEEKELVLKIPILSANDVSSGVISIPTDTVCSISCDNCNRKFPCANTLSDHLEGAHGNLEYSFTCNFCSKQFIHHWFYKRHLKVHHSGIEITFPCQICKKLCNSQKQLEEHKKTEHKKRYPYKCSHCDIACKEIPSLRDHLIEYHNTTKDAASAKYNADYIKQEEIILKQISPNYVHPCKLCNRKFESEKTCDIHTIYEHRGVSSCHVCKKFFHNEADLLRHLQESEHELRRCNFCTAQLKNTATLAKHWEDVHSEIGRHSFYCEICGLRFVVFKNLKAHYKGHLKSVDAPLESNKSNTEIIAKPTTAEAKPGRYHLSHSQYKPNSKFPCKFCFEIFAFRQAMYTHLRNRHPDRAKEVLPIKCSHCDMLFRNYAAMKAHKDRIHAVTKTLGETAETVEFKIDIEEMDQEIKVPVQEPGLPAQEVEEEEEETGATATSQEPSWRQPVRLGMRVHPQYEDFQCQFCAIRITRRGDLYRHIRRQHPNEATDYFNRCTECGLLCNSFKEMKTHRSIEHVPPKEIVIDPNATEFICSVCNKNCGSKRLLNIHANRHLKPAACDECGKRFAQNSELQRHKLTHTGERPHVCPYCLKGFTTGGNLKSHVMIHTGVKPFNCKYCNKKFSHQGNWKSHERAHERNQHNCKYCSTPFVTVADLKAHERLHETIVVQTVQQPQIIQQQYFIIKPL